MKDWFTYFLVIVLFIVLIKQCEGNERTITKTKIEYVKVTDTVTKTIISKPKTVYVERTKTIKGNDSIIYVKEPNDSTIEAKQYNTTLLSNNATAELEITTTGELLDVQGVINYKQKQTTTETLKIRDASGLFLYANMPINSVQPEVGILYQIKNKMFISAGAQYNQFTKSADLKIRLGVKIF